MTDIRLSLRPTLAGAIWPERQSANARAMRAVLLVLGGSVLLTLAAKMAVPFIPVPMTLQTLAVLLIGAIFGTRLAAFTILAYLIEGAVGLPVFTGTPALGIGLSYMAGPTGGYLVGYLFAAAIIGFFAERGADRTFVRLLAAMALGEIVMLAFGAAWLSHLIGTDAAIRLGVLPFVVGEVLKTVLAALLVPALWAMLPKGR